MDISSTLLDILERSGMTKSALCASAGISRSLFDGYLKGRTQPSVAQLARIADAAGFRIDLSLQQKSRAIPPEFVAVLEFGELFSRKAPQPLVNLSPVWRAAALSRNRA